MSSDSQLPPKICGPENPNCVRRYELSDTHPPKNLRGVDSPVPALRHRRCHTDSSTMEDFPGSTPYFTFSQQIEHPLLASPRRHRQQSTQNTPGLTSHTIRPMNQPSSNNFRTFCPTKGEVGDTFSDAEQGLWQYKMCMWETTRREGGVCPQLCAGTRLL